MGLVSLGWALLSITPAAAQATDRSRIVTFMEQAQALIAENHSERAMELLSRAYTLAESGQDYLAAAALNYRIGEFYESTGRYQQALMHYEQGLQALASRQAGAAQIVEQALADLRAGEKTYTPSSGPAVSTDLYRGEIEDLGRLLRQSSPALENELAVALTMNAGNMYLAQNQYTQADALYQKALQAAHRSPARLKAAQIYANLAWSAIKAHRFDAADALLKSAIREIDIDANMLALRRALLAVGVYLRETGRYREAVAELKKAAALYELAEDQTGRCRALTHLATAYLVQGDLRQAKTLYLQALKQNQLLNDNAIAWHANGGLAKTYYRLGDLKAALNHYELYMAAVDRYSSSYFTDQGKVAILEDQAAVTSEYVDAALDLARQTGDFNYARKAIARGRAEALKQLMEANQTRRGRTPGKLPAGPVLYGDLWPTYKLEYARYIAGQGSGGGLASPMAQMAPGVEVAGLPSLSEEAVAGPRKWLPATPPAATFLQTYVLAERTVVLVNTAEETVGGAVADVDAHSLADLIADYRRALDVAKPRGVTVASGALAMSSSMADQTPEASKISQHLYELLIRPIRTLLPVDPQKTVVIIPHQSLWLLPFAALRDKDGRYFGDQHVLTYAVSEATWQIIASRARSSDHHKAAAWVVGNPQMPSTVAKCESTFLMDPLPGAEQEAGEIAELFRLQGVQLFTGPQADRMRLDAWHPNFSVLHFATHGIACTADPLSSFIVLKALDENELRLNPDSETITLKIDSRFPVTLAGAKNILQNPSMPPVREISYPGVLDARTIINEYDLDADLVTLSACQTALGQLTGEGLIGFTRAFLTAGARSVLVSLWRVDDKSTRELMVSFYRQYLEHGNKGLALQSAMAQTRQKYPAPKYWAGFTLVGLAE
ncbi:MAG: CHAT domain-containing tetratricopeptide repeat protein [Desulfobacterales bacterium]|jgi:CHAT domain-containing protein/tetratricopeptide (TPR) repeat protein